MFISLFSICCRYVITLTVSGHNFNSGHSPCCVNTYSWIKMFNKKKKNMHDPHLIIDRSSLSLDCTLWQLWNSTWKMDVKRHFLCLYLMLKYMTETSSLEDHNMTWRKCQRLKSINLYDLAFYCKHSIQTTLCMYTQTLKVGPFGVGMHVISNKYGHNFICRVIWYFPVCFVYHYVRHDIHAYLVLHCAPHDWFPVHGDPPPEL